MRLSTSIFVLSIFASSFGCAEGGPGHEGSGGTSPATSSSASTGGGGGQGGDGGSAGHGGGSDGGGGNAGGNGGSTPSPIVINEISASGTDWVELGNDSAADVDIGGLKLADTTSKGNPDVNDATEFAANTVIPAHSYVLVIGGSKNDGDGLPQTKCLDEGGPATCFYATWKLSSSDGDGVFLIDKHGAILASVEVPANAVADGDTYGRLPDMTGEFTANQPTPGDPNHVP